MPQGRPFLFPDPNDVTPKHPSTFVDSTTILNLYNQENSKVQMQNYCQSVIDWFCNYEDSRGWDDAQIITGTTNGVLLTNKAAKKAFKQ